MRVKLFFILIISSLVLTRVQAHTDVRHDDVEALADACPRFIKSRDTKKFFSTMAKHRADETNTRRVFSYENATWYIEPIYAAKLSNYKKLIYKNFQILIDAQGLVKLRCYYLAKNQEEEKIKFHITTFF